MAHIMLQSVNARVEYIKECLHKRKTDSRAFDSCFEMGDDDVVVTFLVREWEKDDLLKSSMRAWRRCDTLPKSWLECAEKYKDLDEKALKKLSKKIQKDAGGY